MQKDRSFTDGDVRIFRTKIILGPLNGMTLKAPSPTPVFSSGGEQLGYASVHEREGMVEATVSIDYACEERLFAQVAIEKRWIWPAGKIGVSDAYRQVGPDNGAYGIDLSSLQFSIFIEKLLIGTKPPKCAEFGMFLSTLEE